MNECKKDEDLRLLAASLKCVALLCSLCALSGPVSNLRASFSLQLLPVSSVARCPLMKNGIGEGIWEGDRWLRRMDTSLWLSLFFALVLLIVLHVVFQVWGQPDSLMQGPVGETV